MLNENTFILKALSGENIEMAFEDEGKDKIVKIGETKIKFQDLWAVLFTQSNQEQQTDMVPMKMSTNRLLERWVEIKVARDVKKGEKIRFKYRLKIPDEMFIRAHNPAIIADGMNKIITKTRLLNDAKNYL